MTEYRNWFAIKTDNASATEFQWSLLLSTKPAHHCNNIALSLHSVCTGFDSWPSFWLS